MPSVSVEFRDVAYEIPPSGKAGAPTRILSGVSGFVGAGESLAILGPSGSGKTTLLNLLAGQSMYEAAEGHILFGGKKRTSRTKRSMGYVMQDDLFFSNLTVRETLDFTASVRLPDDMPQEEKMTRVENVIASLRLGRCQNTQIGNQITLKGISGGERKRLNIANELISDPTVLLGDECTSGLDSASATTVVELFRELSRTGKTVICTIHQPSSHLFHTFDKVLLLASGRVAYFGTPSGASTYFAHIGFPFPSESYNPADSMLELVIDDLTEVGISDIADEEAGKASSRKVRLLNAWEEYKNFPAYKEPNYDELTEITLRSSFDLPSSDGNYSIDLPTKGPFRALSKRFWSLTGQKERDPLLPKYPAGFLTQLRALGRRCLLQKRGNLLDPVVLTQLCVMTFMFCCFWFRLPRDESTIQERLGCLFFFNLFWGFYATNSTLGLFPSERMVLNKERASGSYRLSAYYIAKTSVEIPADILYPIIFVPVTYFTVNLNPSFTSFILHGISLMLTTLTAISLGTAISATLTRQKPASALANIVLLSSSLVSGFYIEKSNLPVFIRWIRQFSFFKFGFEAMVRIESRGQVLPCVQNGAPHTEYSKNGQVCPITENAILEGVNVDGLGIAGNFACLIGFIFVLRLLGYMSLKYLNKPLRGKKSVVRKD